MLNTSRKTSISHVINDNTVPITSDQHHHQQQQSTSSVCSLKNILSDDSPVQHASSTQQSPPSQQYNHGAGNSGSGGNNNSTVGYGGPYSNEQQQQQVHDYYHPRSHQPPTSQPQLSHNQLSQHHNQKEQFNDAEASSVLLLLSSNNHPSSDSNYIPSRDPYKDIEQQMPDVVETPNISNNIKSNSQQINRQGSKSNSMSITSICCGGESGPSESGNSSMQCGSSMETSKYQQPYPEDTHHQPPIVDYNNPYNHNNNRKHTKKPSNGPIPLMVNTSQKIPQKEPKVIQKRASPQKRRPSDTSELKPPKLHHRNSESNHFFPPTTSKLEELRNQLGENRNDNRMTPITPMVPIQAGMEWDRSHHSQHSQHTQHTHSQQYHQTRPSHNVPPPQAEINRYHPSTMPKNVNSPSLHGDSSKFNNYMNNPNERQLNKTSPNGPPVHVPNGYPHGHGVGPVGGMIGHPDVISQPSHQPHQQPQPIPITQQQMPSLRVGQNSAFSNQIHKKYNDMKHDPKMKRNAPHAYISYMIYTNQMESGKGKDSHLPPQQNNRIIQNGSPTLNNDHAMMNPSMMPINGAIYNHRESQHPNYPPIQPVTQGYIHSSETVTNQNRRVSDPSMRNIPHGYPPTHVNGVLDEHQSSSHRQSISSHSSSPGLLPAHSSANSQQRSILPNLSSSQRHVPNNISPTTSTSRSGSISHQPQISTALPPIQSAPPPSHIQHHHHHNHPPNSQTHHHHYHQLEQTHPHHYHQQPVSQPSQPPPPPSYMSVPPAPLAPQHSSYNGKSSPAPPQPQPPSPINSSRQPNHYHTSPTGPLPQGGSNRLSSSHHHHHHHHHQSTSEPVPSINGSSQNILSQPLTRYLDSQSQSGGYGGSVHPHHHQHLTNGVGLNHPVNIAPAQAQALGPPVPRGSPYY